MLKDHMRLVITSLAAVGAGMAHKLSAWANRLHAASERAVGAADLAGQA